MDQKLVKKTRVADNSHFLLLSFAAGVITIRFLPGLLPPYFSMGTMAICLALLGFLFAPKHRLLGQGFTRLVAITLAFVVGLSWAVKKAEEIAVQSLPETLQRQDLDVTGTVVGAVETLAKGVRFEFSISSLRSGGVLYVSPGRVRLRTYDSNFAPESGETWRLTVRLKPSHGLQNPGSAFDYEAWLFQKRIRATGYVRSGSETRLAISKSPTLWERTNNLRRRYVADLQSALTAGHHAGFVSALSVGIKSGIDDAEWRILQNTGTAHLVAISGLHIGLVALMGGMAVGWLWRRWARGCLWVPSPIVGALGGLVLGIGYGILAGFTLPTRRALCMLVAVVLGIILRRRGKSLEILVSALAMVLLIDPLSPLSASFWLSFIAVAVLVIASQTAGAASVFGASESVSRKVFQTFKQWSRMQWWLLLGMAPVLLLSFHKVSLIAPLANLVAVPVVGMVVVPLCLLGLVAYLSGVEVAWLGLTTAASEVLSWVWRYLAWLDSLPYSHWVGREPSGWALLAAVCGCILMLKGKHLPGRWLGIVWFLPLFAIPDRDLREGEFIYTMLDVGQGLATVVETSRHVMVFDTGAAYPSGFDLGEVAVMPFLRWRGIDRVDRLVVSHNDNDHIGGAAFVVGQVFIDSIYASNPEHPSLVNGQVCRAGQRWRWDGVDFAVLWPREGTGYRGNNASCVIRVTSRNGSLLLTADIEAVGGG